MKAKTARSERNERRLLCLDRNIAMIGKRVYRGWVNSINVQVPFLYSLRGGCPACWHRHVDSIDVSMTVHPGPLPALSAKTSPETHTTNFWCKTGGVVGDF